MLPILHRYKAGNKFSLGDEIVYILYPRTTFMSSFRVNDKGYSPLLRYRVSIPKVYSKDNLTYIGEIELHNIWVKL